MHGSIVSFGQWVTERDIPWPSLDEEHQDFLLGDYVLDLHDEDDQGLLQRARDTVAALQKVFPRRKYKISWAVVAGWASQRPVAQPPPMPRQLGALACWSL